MFDCVPEPVCQTRSGNSAASVPSITSSAARTMSSCRLGREKPQPGVHVGGGLLEDAEGADDRDRHRVAADREVVERALRLGAPVVLGRDLDRPHRVGLGAGRGGGRVRVDGGHLVPRCCCLGWLGSGASLRRAARRREGGAARRRGPTGRQRASRARRPAKAAAAPARRARSSSARTRSAAAAFSSSWATVRAPGIATVLGCEITHARATWAGVAPWAAAISAIAAAAGGLGPRPGRRSGTAVRGSQARAAAAPPSTPPVGEEPLAQRRVGNDEPALAAAYGTRSRGRPGLTQAEPDLVGDDRRPQRPLGLAPRSTP